MQPFHNQDPQWFLYLQLNIKCCQTRFAVVQTTDKDSKKPIGRDKTNAENISNSSDEDADHMTAKDPANLVKCDPLAIVFSHNSLTGAIMAMPLPTRDIHTTFPYLARDVIYQKEKPYATDFIVEDSNVALTNHVFDFMDLVVRDAQPQRESFSLQKNGFCFLKAETSISNDNADDEKFVEKTYFDEIEAVLHDNFPEYTRLECLDYQVRLN